MSESARVDHYHVNPFGFRGMDAVYQCAFMVALKTIQPGVCRFCLRLCRTNNVSQRRLSVHIRFACAEQVQIGAVKQ